MDDEARHGKCADGAAENSLAERRSPTLDVKGRSPMFPGGKGEQTDDRENKGINAIAPQAGMTIAVGAVRSFSHATQHHPKPCQKHSCVADCQGQVDLPEMHGDGRKKTDGTEAQTAAPHENSTGCEGDMM
jgi:hypothetical protein